MPIVARKASLKDAEYVTILDSNPTVFNIKGLVFEIDLNPASAGILQAIRQQLLDDDQESLAIGDDSSIQVMQIHRQALLDEEDGILSHDFFDQVL